MNTHIGQILRHDIMGRYFSPTKTGLAQCHVCSYYILGEIEIIRAHLEVHHSHIITRVQQAIKSTRLSRYYTLITDYEARCSFCEKTINILEGISGFINHYMSHTTTICHEMQEILSEYGNQDMMSNNPIAEFKNISLE